MNQRTHEILNELADLFLTGTERSEIRASAQPATSRRRVRPRAPVHASVVHVRVSDFSQVQTIPAREEDATRSRGRHTFPVPAGDADRLEDTLAQTLDRPVFLTARCPYQSLVRLAVDGEGRLHLWLARVQDDVHAGIVSLVESRFWARDNIDLIALTRPECRFDCAAEPFLHLFTANKRTAAILTGKLGPFLKIHLVQLSSTMIPFDDAEPQAISAPRIVA